MILRICDSNIVPFLERVRKLTESLCIVHCLLVRFNISKRNYMNLVHKKIRILIMSAERQDTS